MQVEIGIDENHDLLKQKLDVYLSCTLVYSRRRNVCRRNVCRRSVVDEMSVDELSWNLYKVRRVLEI